MPQLLVRNLEQETVRRLRERAVRHGRSVEAEHREILRSALAMPGTGASLKELLLNMPDVGEDSDFEHPHDTGRDIDLE